MPERENDDEIRDLYPETGPATEAERERVRAKLAAAISVEAACSRGGGLLSKRGESRWLLPAGAGLSVAGATVLIVLLGGPQGEVAQSSAADILLEAAAAERELAPPLPGPGEYLYVKSENAYLTSYVGAPKDPPPKNLLRPVEPVVPEIDYSYVEPEVREVWMGSEDSLLKTRFGTPEFLSEKDRLAWEADGSPGAKGGVSTDPLGKNDPIDLPSDPDELLEQLRTKAARYTDNYAAPGSAGADEDLDIAELIDVEVFNLIGESLRERSATPAQRAALFQVASRLEGIEVTGETTDSAGRSGIAVAITDPVYGIGHALVFDPKTSALLAEQEVIADEDTAYGYPIGTVIGYSTYLERTIVEESGERP